VTLLDQKIISIKVHDLKDVQRWMRHFNISREGLLAAVEEFGPTVENVSLGLRTKQTGEYLH
jgi:hypothetical protein